MLVPQGEPEPRPGSTQEISFTPVLTYVTPKHQHTLPFSRAVPTNLIPTIIVNNREQS